MTQNLKDSSSAQFRNIQKPIKMWIQNVGPIAIWVTCGEYNAKNGFGGNVGFKQAIVKHSNGEHTLLELNDDGKTGYVHAQYENPCNR